jgi:transglutaminase-like putative cysteine protease
LLHLDVQMQQPEGRLHWSGMLYSVDIPITVDWRLRPQSNLFADQSALLQADMFAARTNATSYKADTFVPIPSIEQLRAAPDSDYPQHIRDRYFSLPATVPERVHQLAQEITNGLLTPYDKAKAIETYLRVNYPYDLEIGAPPEGIDVADYFLFDLKRGYCDYYATAMVVLARSSGIPARFVSGYASGEYDPLNAQYVIRELHAHSWTEVYFPEIGWVEFEPTGSQPEIEREEAIWSAAGTDESDSITREILFQLTGVKLAALFVPLGILIILVTLYLTIVERFVFSRLAPAMAIEILYRRMYRSGRSLAGEPTRAETASEFTDKLIRKVQDVNSKFRRSSLALQKDIRDLTKVYQDSLFTAHTVAQRDVTLALTIWKRLRWSLIVERIKHLLWIRNKALR